MAAFANTQYTSKTRVESWHKNNTTSRQAYADMLHYTLRWWCSGDLMALFR